MPNKTFRTIGAAAVLLGIAIAAMARVGPDEPSAIEIAAPSDTAYDPLARQSITTPAPEPFAYRVGLLAGVSTTNFWEYIGDQPTAWNAYVLGPTKPALYGIDPARNELTSELAEGEPAEPTWNGELWSVSVPLRDDLSWSDGRPVTATDVVYTFKTVRRLGLSGGWGRLSPAEIESVVAESEHELRIEFTERPGLQVWPFGVGLAPVMPSHAWSTLTKSIDSSSALYELDGTADVSGGPLQLTTLNEERIQAVANPGYPGSNVDRVFYTVFPDEASAVSALESGEIDTIVSPNGLSAEGVASLDDATAVAIEKSPANSMRYLGFNLNRDPMSGPAFRQALALLIDRESATNELAPGASVAYTMLSSANSSWFDEKKAGVIAETYRGELSTRLTSALTGLREEGYAWDTPPSVVDSSVSVGQGLTIDGMTPAPLTILTPGDEYDPTRADYTRRIEETLESLGFDVRPVVTDFDTVVDLAFTEDDSGAKQYDMYLLGWTLGNAALPDYYRWFFSADGAANSTGYADSEFEAQLARYEEATDLPQAKSALWEMEKTLAEDLPYLVLYHPEIVEAYRSDRLEFESHGVLGGIQGRLDGIADLSPAS